MAADADLTMMLREVFVDAAHDVQHNTWPRSAGAVAWVATRGKNRLVDVAHMAPCSHRRPRKTTNIPGLEPFSRPGVRFQAR